MKPHLKLITMLAEEIERSLQPEPVSEGARELAIAFAQEIHTAATNLLEEATRKAE